MHVTTKHSTTVNVESSTNAIKDCSAQLAALQLQVTSQQADIDVLKAELKQKNAPPMNMGERLKRMAAQHIPPISLFDFTQFASRPIALKVAYCGWDLYGLTCQDNDIVETVEFHLYSALINSKLITSQHECRFARSGRTDKGVSSYGQVVSLFVRSAKPLGVQGTLAFPLDLKASYECELAVDEDGFMELPYVTMLNRHLPSGIRVLEWAATDGIFDSRFSCTHRMYKYYIPSKGLDMAAMHKASQLYIGNLNFRNFCKPDLQRLGSQSFVRSIFSASVYDINQDDKTNACFQNESFMVFCVKGKGFLWHQVRMMVSLLILIGKGRETEQVILELLDVEKNPRKPNYFMASELPLVLVECGYANTVLDWQCDASKETAEEKVIASFIGLWRSVSTKQAILAGVLGNQYQDKEIEFQAYEKGRDYTHVMKLSKLRSEEEAKAWLMKTPRKRYMFTMVGQNAEVDRKSIVEVLEVNLELNVKSAE